MFKHLSVHITLALIIGLFLGVYLNLSTPNIWYITGGSFSGLLAIYIISNKVLNPKFYFALATFILFTLIGVSRITLNKEVDLKTHYTHHLKKTNALVLKIDNVLKPSKNYQKYAVSVTQIDSQKTRGKVLLYLKKDSTQTALKIGQFIFTNATIRELPKPQNPFQFNYKAYLENKQIYRQIYTDKSAIIILKKRKISLYSLAQDFRNKVINQFENKGLKGNELAVVKALLLGEKQDISASLRQDYANAGAVHILAISGLHIGIIMFLLSWLFKPLELLKRGKSIKLILIILFLWLYAVIAGLSPSIIRATTMFTALSISLFSKRKTDVYNILALSAFVLLLFNPHYLFDVGFQMSYLAVLAIVAMQPKLVLLWRPHNKIIRYFWELFCVSTAAQIGVVPLSLYYFHQFPGLFFLTNLMVIPLLGFILGYGLFLVFLASVNLLPTVFVEAYQYLIRYLNIFISWVSHQEAFLIQNISFSLILMLSSYLVIVTFYSWMIFKKRSVFILSIIAIVGWHALLFYEQYTVNNNNSFVVFNSYKKPLIAVKKEATLYVLKGQDTTGFILKPYQIGAQIKKTISDKRDRNLFLINNKKVLIVDKAGVFEPLKKEDIIVLTNSPKINLERLIKQLNPQLIIADNSNYTSFIKRWKKTCQQLKISFYDVSKKGAFIYRF